MRIAVAKDEAFNFIYRANIDALKVRGEVVFFSPLHNIALPTCDWLYLPGGYPELFADLLSDNSTMRKSILDYVEAGGNVFAECGGFMYLCRSIDDKEMCGVFPFRATLKNARLHLGYRMIGAKSSCFRRNNDESLLSLPLAGDKSPFVMKRGHEFHYSALVMDDVTNMDAVLPKFGVSIERVQYSAKGVPVNTEIFHYKNVTAGYTHWYWAED